MYYPNQENINTSHYYHTCYSTPNQYTQRAHVDTMTDWTRLTNTIHHYLLINKHFTNKYHLLVLSTHIVYITAVHLILY